MDIARREKDGNGCQLSKNSGKLSSSSASLNVLKPSVELFSIEKGVNRWMNIAPYWLVN
jgi:hypothetical protein